MEDRYANREIDNKFAAVLEKIGDFEKNLNSRMGVFEVTTRDSLAKIQDGVDHTNGAVAEANTEIALSNKRIDSIQLKLAYAYGFIAAIGLLLFSAAIPIIAAYIGTLGH